MATCDACHNFQPFDIEQLPAGQKAVIFVVAKHLKASAETGCQSCTLICDALSLFRKSWSEQGQEDAIELQVSPGQPLLVLFRPRNGLGIYLDIYANAGKFRESSTYTRPTPLRALPFEVIPPLSLFLKTVSSQASDQPRACSGTRVRMNASNAQLNGCVTA
jgi:hypothetical protein